MKRFLKNVLIVVASLVAFYYLARFTYHQGWWGRDNLIARSMWLCSGPPELEESFYPDNVDVLVSACDAADEWGNQGEIYVLPEKGVLQLVSYQYDPYEWHFIDIESGEESILESKVRADNIMYWLSNDMLLAENYAKGKGQYVLYKPSTQEMLLELPLLKVTQGDLMEAELVTALSGVETIIIHDRDDGLALAKNYATNPDKNFVFSVMEVPKPLEEFLKKYALGYALAPQSNCTGYPQQSPSGRFEARHDGIYRISDGEFLAAYNLGDEISSGYFFSGYFLPCGWLSDESGVILGYREKLPEGMAELFPQKHFHQPVLKFYLPEELIQ